MAEKSTYKKKKSIIWYSLAGLLLVTLLGLFLLPSLLSTEWAENKIKQAVNTRLPGKINFDALSLSWTNGIKSRDITYENRSEGILVKVEEITISKGLLALAANYKEIGIITVKAPKIYIHLDDKVETPSDTAFEVSEKTSQDSSISQPGEPAETSSPMTMVPLEGSLIITGGAVKVVYPDMKEKPLLKGLELKAHLVGLENLLDYQVVFQSGDNIGQVKGAGTFTLTSGDGVQLDETHSEAELDIEKWEITDLLLILAHFVDIPSGSGQINGHMKVSGSTSTGLKLKGNLTGRQIKLQGGPLKSDTPSLDKVVVEVDAEKTAGIITLNQLTLTSALATATVLGTFEFPHKKEITGQAEIDLAQLFAQFPSSLSLKEGTRVSNGKVDLKVNVSSSGKATHFDGSARLDKLQGFAGGKKVAWDEPVIFEAKGELSAVGLSLDKFAVQSAFLNGTGQGDINHMKIQLAADIGAALKEIEKFIQLEGWKSDGKMDLNLQVATKSKILRSVAAEVNITDFVLNQKNRIIAPRNSFKANMATDLRLNQDMQLQEMENSSFDFHSWIGSGAISLKKLAVPSKQVSLQFKELDFKGAFDLRHLTALLWTFGALPQDTRLGGKVNINTRLSFKGNSLELDKTTIDAVDFLFQKDKQKFNEKKIHLTTGGSVNLEEKSANLKPLDLKITAGSIALPELVINDWAHLPSGIKTSGSVDLDLGPLTLLLGDVLNLSPGTTIAGRAALKIVADMTDAKKQFVRLDGNIGRVEVAVKGKQPFSEESIGMMMDIRGDVLEQNFTFHKLELSSAPVSLKASGTVIPDKLEQVLNAEGSISLDLKLISGYLKNLVGLDLEMIGATQRPFVIKVTSVNGEWGELPKQSQITTSFHADIIRGFGLLIESLEVPVHLANALAEIDIQATVNRGKMSLKSAIDFTADTPVVSIQENSQVLTGVGFSEEMSNDLLAKIHPLFKGAAISEGTMDLGLHHFRWPLDAAERKAATFAGSITFNDVKLRAGGLLTALLEVMKANEREIVLGDQPMEFIGENDRIRCSPLEIKTKDHILLMSGSVGFDQSLDYKVQIPVTRDMVGSDMYKYLEGTFITVPIGGTVAKPSLRKDIVQTALKDLIIQAGKKQITDQAGKFLQNLFK